MSDVVQEYMKFKGELLDKVAAYKVQAVDAITSDRLNDDMAARLKKQMHSSIGDVIDKYAHLFNEPENLQATNNLMADRYYNLLVNYAPILKNEIPRTRGVRLSGVIHAEVYTFWGEDLAEREDSDDFLKGVNKEVVNMEDFFNNLNEWASSAKLEMSNRRTQNLSAITKEQALPYFDRLVKWVESQKRNVQ